MKSREDKVLAGFHDELTKIAIAMQGLLPGAAMGALGALYLQRKIQDMRTGAALRRQQAGY